MFNLLINYSFAFTNSRSLSMCCSSTWLHVVIATTTLIGTQSSLKGFVVL